jgi:hypothetical protein
MRGMFPLVRDAVARVIDPAQSRWIGWSHFEVDECGALNEWLAAAPRATPVCGQLGAMINVADFSDRPPKALDPGEMLATGRHRFRFVPMPHLPHRWDAGVLFDETDHVLLCSRSSPALFSPTTMSWSPPYAATSLASTHLRSRCTVERRSRTSSWTTFRYRRGKGRCCGRRQARLTGRNADVLRRQCDGSWRFVIDNPWGVE